MQARTPLLEIEKHHGKCITGTAAKLFEYLFVVKVANVFDAHIISLDAESKNLQYRPRLFGEL